MERKEIDRIERDDTYDNLGAVGRDIEKKAPPPPPKTEQPQESGKTIQTIEPPKDVKVKEKEKVNIQDHKKKKDQMTVELERLIEKVKEANRMKDNKAKEKAQEEMRKASGQIYKLTDEATGKNEGKLPEGWWGK